MGCLLIHGVLEVMPAADYSACLKEAQSPEK